MMHSSGHPTCPHCGETIELMSASEVVDAARLEGWAKFHINYLGKLVKDGKFPQPWLASAGRQFWLHDQFSDWWLERGADRRRQAAEAAAAAAAGMTSAQRRQYLKEIQAAVEAIYEK